MNLIVYADNTLPLALEPLCRLLNANCDEIKFQAGEDRLYLRESAISRESYQALPASILSEAATFDFGFVCTAIPYENNYFFDGEGNVVIISFSDWNQLTDLPVTNGLVYFIASIICDKFGIGVTHEKNTGCINDFWWDKTGINGGMRAAFICRDCRDHYRGAPNVLRDVESLLNLVSQTSRDGKDVVDIVTSSSTNGGTTGELIGVGVSGTGNVIGKNITIHGDVTVNLGQPSQTPSEIEQGPKASNDEANELLHAFDVFLCHNSDDKPGIRQLNSWFKEAGIRTWLDEEQLPLGLPWQPELEKQIASVRAACVFVGVNGIGPWQNVEIRAFLSEFAHRGCPVIPVILPNATKVPELPIFLKQMTWIDLRRDYQPNLQRLVDALKPK